MRSEAAGKTAARTNAELVRAHRKRLRWRAIRAVLGPRKKLRCQQCRAIESLQFAHVFPTALRGPGRGQYRRWLDVIRNPECYLILCRDCHVRFDNETD